MVPVIMMIPIVIVIAAVMPAVIIAVPVPLPLIVVDIVVPPALVHVHLVEDRAAKRAAIEAGPIGVHGDHPIARLPPPAMAAAEPLADHPLCAHGPAAPIREPGIGTALHDDGTLRRALSREWRCDKAERQTGNPTDSDAVLHSGLKVLGNGRPICERCANS